MQLLESIHNRPPEAVPNHLLASLQDIANNVQIQSNFCIRHPDYKPLELPAEVSTRFQRLPIELQHKYLNLQLQSFVYGIYYNGFLQDALAPETESEGVALPPNLENNTFLGIDLEFYEHLHQSNCGEGYFNPGWQVVRQQSDGSLAVIKDGLTLHIERDRHLKPLDQSADIGDVVAVRLPRNLIENGFYVAVGNAGAERQSLPNSNSVTVCVYFHLTPEGAVAVMAGLTRQLNKLEIPFSLKALYNPADYKCYNSAMLYLNRSHYPAVRQVLQKIYAENQANFKSEVPLFTLPLAPGLALAEEPNERVSVQDNFGIHRCQIVACGLLETWYLGDTSPEGRMKSIQQQFSLLGIDWQRPYLTANSESVYPLLDI